MHCFDILSRDGCRTNGLCPVKRLRQPSHGGRCSRIIFFSPGKSLPQRMRSSPAPHAVRGLPPLSAVSHQNLWNSIRNSSSESAAPIYRASPATRGASASVLPPMWASTILRREKRRVFPLTTSCAAALNVSWGTCACGVSAARFLKGVGMARHDTGG